MPGPMLGLRYMGKQRPDFPQPQTSVKTGTRQNLQGPDRALEQVSRCSWAAGWDIGRSSSSSSGLTHLCWAPGCSLPVLFLAATSRARLALSFSTKPQNLQLRKRKNSQQLVERGAGSARLSQSRTALHETEFVSVAFFSAPCCIFRDFSLKPS